VAGDAFPLGEEFHHGLMWLYSSGHTET
jgi:hypothetical protein